MFPCGLWKREGILLGESDGVKGEKKTTHFALRSTNPQASFQSVPKGPLQQRTRSAGPDHQPHLLAEEVDADRRRQLRFLHGGRHPDELRRVEQAEAEGGGEDVERLPHVDGPPPAQQDECVARDDDGCRGDAHALVSFRPVNVTWASAATRNVTVCVFDGRPSRHLITYLLIRCPPRIAPTAFPTGPTAM